MLPLLFAAALLLPPGHHLPALAHESADGAPDVTGTYAGTLPCADCAGFATRLRLVTSPHTHGLQGIFTETRIDNLGEAWTTPGGSHNAATPYLLRGIWKLKPDAAGDAMTLILSYKSAQGTPDTDRYHVRDNSLFNVNGLGKEDAVLVHMMRLRDGHEYPDIPPNDGVAPLPR